MQWRSTILALALAPATLGRSIDNRLSRRQGAGYQFINQTQFYGHEGPVTVSVAVNGGGRNATAPLLYGWMHEDISHSGDGGIYGEALSNRAFQGSGASTGSIMNFPGSYVVDSENPILPWGPIIEGWHPIGAVDLSLTLLHPLSKALPVAMEFDIPYNATGEVGFYNEGWWGIDVRPGTYNASFYVKRSGPRGNGTLSHIDVSLRSNLTGEVFATSSIPFAPNNNISDFVYTQYFTQIEVTSTAPNSNNTFAVTFDGSEVAGDSYYFGLLSLFPETYNNQPNGLRKDLGAAIVDLGSKILRFPGGNNIEGYSIDQRWKWNETIGPLIDRPGRIGDWGYYNTQGLGLAEYLQFCQDAGIEPVLAVYAGYSLDLYGQAGVSFPEDQMHLVLEDILNEIEYVKGDVSTTYGALRASHGYPEPFTLNYIEIGNEDWFSTTYPYRFPYLYNGIKQAHPELTIVSTAYNEANVTFNYTIDLPPGTMWDTHHYEEPSFFLNQFDNWDNWQERTNNPNVTVYVGEYSVFQVDTPSGQVNYSMPMDTHIFYPNLLAAIGEAVYLIGAERNPNVLKMTSYAPSFVNLNHINWTPDLVAFTANHDETVFSASYNMQQLLAHHRGTETLPVTTKSGDFNPLWWVSTIDTGSNVIYFKVVNSGTTAVPLTIDFDVSYSSVNGTILTAPSLSSFNYVNNQTEVVAAPITNLPASSGQTFTWSVPQLSVTVLEFALS